MKSLSICAALALAGCGGKSGPPQGGNQPPGPQQQAADDPGCPLLVPGTSISVEDLTNGAALVFVTTGDALAVRARAAKLAEMYTKQDGPASSLAMMFSPGNTAIATEVPGGARVEFTSDKPDGAANIQKELHMHGGMLTTGSCGM